MGAFNGCLGTAKADSAEILGLKMWKLSEQVKSEEYADNTTDCATKDNIGPLTQTVQMDVNVQDGTTKGKPPLRAGDSITTLELHIDDSGDNYWSGAAIVLEMNDYTVDPSTGSLVSVSYNVKIQGRLTGNGTLADAS